MKMHALEMYLEKNFRPRCIQEGEDPISAHRFAAKVELAQQLLRMIRKDSEDAAYEGD